MARTKSIGKNLIHRKRLAAIAARGRKDNDRIVVGEFRKNLAARAARRTQVRRDDRKRDHVAFAFRRRFENRDTFRAQAAGIRRVFDIATCENFSRLG